MANELVNKIIYNGNTLIDLTGDTITAADVINSKTFHLKDGSVVTGSCTYDADTSDADALAGEILATKTAYVSGTKVTGTMPNRGQVTTAITTVSQSVTIQNGYHDGSGSVSIDSTEQAKIVAGNIKTGVEILGVTGTYTGTEIAQAHTTVGSATPSTTQQVILPSDYNEEEGDDFQYFSQFTVAPIPYTETVNSAGGLTVTIG